MGGLGSGRFGRKVKCESLRRFDLREIVRDGKFTVGRHLWGWNRNIGGESKNAGTVSFEVCGSPPSVVILSYHVNGQEVRRFVAVEYTLCNYGGSRPWFRCGCGRRSLTLYYFGGFRCRLCANLTYQTQTEKPADRLCTKAWRIRQRLGQVGGGLGDFFPLKPKGMRRKTYDRLVRIAEEAEAC
jgi:hypothetical protein